jgi:hypothetical protein
MSSIFGRDEGPRFARGQKFRLSTGGIEAQERYQEAVRASHEQGGRAAFDAAANTWAAASGLRPGDALYLCELGATTRTLQELVESLENCGATKADAKAALQRLITARLAEAVAVEAR